MVNQTVEGGFQSASTSAPNPEETALALTALGAALAALPPGGLRLRAQAAAEAGSAYLRRALAENDTRSPALWTGKVLMAPQHIIQALVLSSLIGIERGGAVAAAQEPRPDTQERLGLELEAAELRRKLEDVERRRTAV